MAEGVIKIAVARMTSAIPPISIQRGPDPRDFTLIAFGGAGPMHAVALAEEIGLPRVLIPRHPGNSPRSASSPRTSSTTRVGPLRERASLLEALFGEMEAPARRQLELEGFGPEAQRAHRRNTWTAARVASLRYGHHIAAPDRTTLPRILTMWDAAHTLGVSPMTVRRLITRKMLPATHPVPDAPWAIRPEDLQLAHAQRAVAAVKQGHRLPQPSSETQLTLNDSQT